MNKKLTLIVFVLIVCLSGLMMLGFLTNSEGWGADYAGFITQAMSIIEGNPREYTESNRFTIEKSTEPMGPIAYPWGYPLLLAPIYKLFGLNFLALKSVAAISYLLFLGAFWFVFRKDHSPIWFLLLLCLFAFNTRMLEYINSIFSDLPFLLVSTISVWLIHEIIVQERQIFSPLIDLIITGFIITAAFLLRTNGILLLATLCLSQIIASLNKVQNKQQSIQPVSSNTPQEKRVFNKKLLVDVSPYMTFLLLVLIWRYFLPEGGNSHLAYLKNITMDSITSNFLIYVETSLEFFKGVPVPYIIMGASVPLAVAGAFRRYRTDYPAILYILMTLLLYIIWPYNVRFRFLFPILPFYFSYAFSGLEDFINGSTKIEKVFRRVMVYLPVIVVTLFFLYANLDVVTKRIRGNDEVTSGPYAPLSQEMFSFIENHTEPDDVIVFIKPRLMSMLTDRQSIRITKVGEISRGDYLSFYLIDDFRREYQLSELEIERLIEQGSIYSVFENNDFIIYHITLD